MNGKCDLHLGSTSYHSNIIYKSLNTIQKITETRVNVSRYMGMFLWEQIPCACKYSPRPALVSSPSLRAETILSGVIVRPDPDNAGSSKMSVLLQNDIKGWIPHFIVNAFTARAPEKWRESLATYYKEHYTGGQSWLLLRFHRILCFVFINLH